jgi:His/Glu/Gln/Arg/opine family amino acid ABC transporter permease subunit
MPHIDGFFLQILAGVVITIKLACCAALVGMMIGLFGSLLESIRTPWLRYTAASFIFIIRGLPELLVLFFIYFGITAILSNLFHHYINISAFAAGVIALGLIFGAYASQVFRGAYLAVETGQIDAGRALGLDQRQIFIYIQLPQAWRHALPGLGNLWLVLLKDTAIVSLIGLSDIMNQAKIAASTTHQPFTFYLIAALMYLVITSLSQQVLNRLSIRANRYIHA